jgi:hypothetical protein
VEELKKMGFVDKAVGLEELCPIQVLKQLEASVKEVKVHESYRIYQVRETSAVEEIISDEQWQIALDEIEALRSEDSGEAPEEPEQITESCKRIKLVLDYVKAPVRLYEALYSGKEAQSRSYIRRYGVEV